MKLAVPLYKRQIDAAGMLRQNLQQWQKSDAALVAPHKKFPGFTPEACLLKSVAVNAIYSTNVLAIVRVANHVKDVLSRHNLAQAGAELVIEIANSPDEKGRRFRSRMGRNQEQPGRPAWLPRNRRAPPRGNSQWGRAGAARSTERVPGRRRPNQFRLPAGLHKCGHRTARTSDCSTRC